MKKPHRYGISPEGSWLRRPELDEYRIDKNGMQIHLEAWELPDGRWCKRMWTPNKEYMGRIQQVWLKDVKTD